jgi:hypothetical protein
LSGIVRCADGEVSEAWLCVSVAIVAFERPLFFGFIFSRFVWEQGLWMVGGVWLKFCIALKDNRCQGQPKVGTVHMTNTTSRHQDFFVVLSLFLLG